jgi:peptidoglycan/LPS O-acetylase OafA/YrhL
VPVPPEEPAKVAGPIIGIGWTLHYEMYFYFVFAVSLMLWRRRATLIASAFILLTLVVVKFLGSGAGAFQFYGRSVALEFLLGMAAHHVWKRLPSNSQKPEAFRWGFLFSVVAALVALPAGEIVLRNGLGSRIVMLGLPAFLLVISVLGLERMFRVRFVSRPILVASEATYMLFLTHEYVLVPVARRMSGIDGAARILVAIVTMASAVILAVAAHRFFERPIMAWLKVRLLSTREGLQVGAFGPP